MEKRENPVEAFKRHTAACMRAIARRDDVQASFVPSGQGLVGEEARLTMPARDLPPGDVALTHVDLHGPEPDEPLNLRFLVIWSEVEMKRGPSCPLTLMSGTGGASLHSIVSSEHAGLTP